MSDVIPQDQEFAEVPLATVATVANQVIELEIRLAYQDRVIEQLDDVVRSFSARVELLERELRAMRASVAANTALGPADDKPPHY